MSGADAHDGAPQAGAQHSGAPRRAGVVIASTSAANGTRPDQHAPLLEDGLAELGFEVFPTRIVSDGAPVGQAIRELLADGARLVVTSGGTGVTADDRTPEETCAIIEREIPGLMERVRALGGQKSPFAALTRGLCGTVGDAVVINAPGSRGAIADTLTVLAPVVHHLLDQLEGSHEH